MNIPNQPTSQHDGILGPLPTIWYNDVAVNANVYPFNQAPAGSLYMSPTGNWQKTHDGWVNMSYPAINVRDFGAVADGETDDTAAFQAAIDAAVERSRGTVYVPSGYYRASQIVLKNGVTLIGEGTKKAIAANTGVTGSWVKQLAGVNDNLIVLDPSRVGSWQESSGIMGMRFTGEPTNTLGSGLHTEGVRLGEDFKLTYCWFEDFAADGVTIDAGTQPGMLSNLHLFRNGAYGINASRGSFDLWQTCELANISGDSNGTALIRLATGMNSLTNGSSFLIRNVKSEVGILGTQADTIVLDNLLGSHVTVLNCNVILTGDSTGANSIIKITGSRCNLMWSGLSCDSDSSPLRAVTYFINDTVNSVNISPSEENFFGRYGANFKIHGRLIRSGWTSFANGATAPNISTGDRWRTANSSATTMTGVAGAVDGQEFFIRVNDNNTTFKHNGAVGSETPFAFNTSSDRLASQTDVYHFVVVDGFAREVQDLGRDQKVVGRLIKSTWAFMTNGATTINVGSGDRFRTQNSGATSLTGVTNAVDGQEFLVQVNDANTTFVHNGAVGSETPFAMQGSANKTGTTSDVFHFVIVGGFAREVRRA